MKSEGSSQLTATEIPSLVGEDFELQVLEKNVGLGIVCFESTSPIGAVDVDISTSVVEQKNKSLPETVSFMITDLGHELNSICLTTRICIVGVSNEAAKVYQVTTTLVPCMCQILVWLMRTYTRRVLV